MVVALLLAALAIIGCVVLAALGRAGEMATFPPDCPPLGLDGAPAGVSAADVALLRPPMALWGYQVRATEEALQLIARSVTARDTEIAALRRQLEGLRKAAPGAGGDERTWPVSGAGGDERAWPAPGPPGRWPPQPSPGGDD